MKLTKSEIKYLSASFAPQTPISIFANIEAEVNSGEYQSLSEKGVIVNNAYSREALDLLTLLTKPDKGARFLAQTPNFIIEKFTYRVGDSLIIAENYDGVLDINKVDNVHDLAPKFVEAFGMSGYSSTDIDFVFTPNELIVLLSLADLTRKRKLADYAGIKTTSGSFSESDINAEIDSDYKNGLTGMFTKNYRIAKPSLSDRSKAIADLVSKGVIADAAGYKLVGEYEKFAQNFLVLETIAFYESFGILPGGEIATIARLAACAGKHEVLSLFYDGDLVQMNTTSGLQLLYNIEAFMSCPTFEKPPEVQVPVTPPVQVAPPPPIVHEEATPPQTVAGYAPAETPVSTPVSPTVTSGVAPGSWTCAACGRTNTGNFCAGCGSRRP